MTKFKNQKEVQLLDNILGLIKNYENDSTGLYPPEELADRIMAEMECSSFGQGCAGVDCTGCAMERDGVCTPVG